MEELGSRRKVSKPVTDPAVVFARPRLVVLTLLIISVALGSQAVSSAQPTPAQSSSASPQPSLVPDATPAPLPTPDPLSQVAWRIESLALTLRDIAGRLDSRSDVATAIQSEADERDEMQFKAQETLAILAGAPTLQELGELELYWRQVLASIPPRKSILVRREAVISADLALLIEEQKYWKDILAQTSHSEANEQVHRQISDSLKNIESLINRINAEQRSLIATQSRLDALSLLGSGLDDRIAREHQQFQKRLFQRDSLPIWKFALRRESGEAVDSVTKGSIEWAPILGTEIRREHLEEVVAIVLVFLVTLGFALSLRRLPAPPARPGTALAPVTDVVQRPLAFALVVSLIFAINLQLSLPISVLRLFALVLVIPIVRFVVPMVGAHWRILVYLLAGSFAWTVAKYAFIPPSALRREVEAVLFTGVIAAFFVITLRRGFRVAVNETRWSRIAIRFARVVISILILTLLANIFGFMRFAQVISRAAVVAAFQAVVLFLMVRVCVSVLSAVLKTERARTFATVRLREGVILRWARGLLGTIAILLWIASVTELFMVGERLGSLVTAVLTFRITLGTLAFSIGNILTVFVVLGLGFAFATAVRFVAREEVLSRLRLSRGLPELITTLLYYGLIVIVIVMAFGAAGVEFSRLTLITGALGVGIGFGLQNIVNNFVSGLILQFERPIHIGDILEVGGLTGEVTRIGARSSTIITGLGAEVIVPNADLVSGRVINWTLSSERRRVDLAVSVDVTSEPTRVIEILKGAANANPRVVQDPAPVAFFQSVGETGLNFVLEFWAPDRRSYFQLRSEVGVAVVDALKANGIEMTASQRNLVLKLLENVTQERALKAGSKDGETATTQKP